MRINNNVSALNAQKQNKLNNEAVANRFEKLSSGKRINRSADDAAGLAISERMRSQIMGALTASRNTQDGISLIQTAEGGLQSIHEMLQRAREIAVQSANDTNDNNVDRPALQGEFENIVNEIDDTADKTEFNGVNVLNGETGTVSIQSGPNEGDTTDIEIGAMTASALLGLQGDEYDAATDANVTSSAAASSTIGTIDNAINDVSMQRANLGAMQNRLEFRMQALDIQAENATAAESRIRDSDMAKMMTELTAKSILQKASTAVLAQANARPQGILGMLG
ncbi:MAG: flagellin [Oscillospiraceae bacterium]|nr:flagellin [Oscillospiraceae bacterium]